MSISSDLNSDENNKNSINSQNEVEDNITLPQNNDSSQQEPVPDDDAIVDNSFLSNSSSNSTNFNLKNRFVRVAISFLKFLGPSYLIR